MHKIAYLLLATTVILLSLSYITKENFWIINKFKTNHAYLNVLIDTQIFSCLMYFSLAYVYIIEGYMEKITYIYDETNNSEEDKQKKKKTLYNLILTYVIIFFTIFIVLKKLMDKRHNSH